MRNSIFFLLITAFLLSLASCKKEDLPAPCTLSQANLAGQWKIIAATFKQNSGSPAEDVYSEWTTCEKDDLYVIDADENISIQRTPACGDADPGDYVLTGNEFYAYFNSGFYYEGVIADFTCSSFKVVETYPTGEIYSYTFQKQ